MSQDDKASSARRKRETLGAVSHNVSAIPMPASAMKRSFSNSNLQQPQVPHTTNHVRTTSASRMSLAPGRPAQPVFQRSSSGENLAPMGFSTVQRPSTANFLTATTTGRKSYAPFTTSTPANPIQLQESTQRRSSVYSQRPSAGFGPAAHQSFFAQAPPPKGDVVDPRRLTPATRTQMGQELLDFLVQRNFELETKHTLSNKSMISPMQKEFDLMFVFLYHCIDPAYRFQKGIQTEVPDLLKQLRYPFANKISKSALGAVGGANWSQFLALLHWMMQLAKMMESYSVGSYDDACIEAGYDVSSDRITFQFLSDAYKEWLSIEDDDDEDESEAKRRIEPHVQAMAAKFEQANEANLEQVKQLEDEAKTLQDQIDELSKSAPKLAKLDETIKVLEEDRVKFEKYNQDMERKIERYLNKAQFLQENIEKCEQEMREAEEERKELQNKVDDQGLSVQDIDRMNSERERLQKSAETTTARLEDSKQRTASKEEETGAKLDELESSVHKYNSLGYQIGVIPANALNARGNEYELHLTVNAGPNFTASQLGNSTQQMLETDRLLSNPNNGYSPHHLLQKDLKACKSHLQDLRKDISERRNAALEEDMAKMDMLDKTKEALDDKAAEMSTLEHRLRAAQEEFEKTKELTSTQNLQSDVQIEKMEKQLSKTRGELSESVQLMEQREMNTNLEYEQLTVRCSALREELHTDLERILSDIIKFKIHIQQSLEGYEDFVAAEVDREWAEQEAATAPVEEMEE